MPNARVGPNPNPNTYDGCMVNNNRGRGVGGGGGGGKHGITMQDLKKQTAMRLAHEQQQMMVPGNANNTNSSSSVSGGLSLHPNPNHPQGRSSMHTHNNNVVMNSYNTNYQSGVPVRFVPNNVMASPNNNKPHHYNNNTSMLYPQQGVVAASSVPHHHHQDSHPVLNDYRDLRERNQQQVLQHNKPSMIYSNNNNNLQHHHPPSSSIGSSYSHSQYGVPDVMSETSSIRSSAFDETSFTNNNNNNSNVSSQHHQNQYTNTTNESSSGNNYHNIHSNQSTPTFHRHTSSSEGYHHNQHIRQVMKSNPSLESVSSSKSISSKGSNSRRHQNSRNKNNKEVMDTNNSSGDQVLMQAHSNLSSSSSRHPNHHVHHVHPMQQQQFTGNNMNQQTDSLQQQGQHQPKLPHGLTVHELKEMTRARLAVERNKPPAESASTKEEGERGVPEMIQKTYTEDTTGSSGTSGAANNIWQRTTTTTSTGTNIKNTRHLQHTFSSSGGNSVGQHGSPVRQQHQQLLPSSQSSTTVDSLLGKFVKPSNGDCGGSSAAPVVVYNRPHLNSVDSGSVTSYNTLGSEYLASDSASLSFLGGGGGSSSTRNYNQFSSENHPNNQDDENFLFRSYSYPSNTNNNNNVNNSTTDLLLDHSQYPEEISKSRSFFEPSSSNNNSATGVATGGGYTPSRRRLGSSPPGFKVAHEDRPLLRSVAEDLVEIPGLSLDRTIRHRGCTSTSNSGNLMNDEVSSHKSQGSCSVFSESTNFTKNTSSHHHQHHHNDYASGILASVKSMPDDLENLTRNSTSLLSNEALHHSRNTSLSGLNDLPNWVAESVLNTVGDEVGSNSVEETFMDKSDKKNGADAVFRNTYSSSVGSFSNNAGCGVPSSTSNGNLGNNYISINNNNSNNASSSGFLYPGLGMSECGSTGSFCGSTSAVSDLFSGNLGILSFGGVGEPPTTTSTGEQENDLHHHHHDTSGAILQTSNTFPLISSSFISAKYNSAGRDLFNSNNNNNNDIMDPPVVLAPSPPLVSNKFLNSNDRVSVSNMGVDLVETLRNTHLSSTNTTTNNNDNDRPSTAGSTLSSSSTNSQSQQTHRHPKQQHRRNRGPNSRRRQRINRSNHRKGTNTTSTDTNTSRTNQNNQHWK